MDKYVEVYTARDITLAYLMKAQLETAGIPVQIGNENLQGALCIDGMAPRVLIPETQAEQARQVLAEFEHASADTADIGEEQ